jgi:hypothetical protein
MFNGHRRRNDLLSTQIGQLCASFVQVPHASAADHNGGSSAWPFVARLTQSEANGVRADPALEWARTARAIG